MLKNNKQGRPMRFDTAAHRKLYLVDIEHQLKYLEDHFALLSPLEKKTSALFKQKKRQEQYIVSKGMSRIILSRYLKRDPATLQFKQSDCGKPYIDDCRFGARGLFFNISHTMNYSILGIASVPIGVDIERFNPLCDENAIADLYFTPEEKKVFSHIGLSSKKNVFYEIWTRKEALLKVIGVGLSEPLLQSISVVPFEKKIFHLNNDASNAHYYILETVFLEQEKCFLSMAIASDSSHLDTGRQTRRDISIEKV